MSVASAPALTSNVDLSSVPLLPATSACGSLGGNNKKGKGPVLEIEPAAAPPKAPVPAAPKKSTHAQNGRRKARKGGAPTATDALAAATVELADKAGGNALAAKELAKEKKELEKELDEASKKLKKAEVQLEAVSARSEERERTWQQQHRVVVKGKHPSPTSWMAFAILMTVPFVIHVYFFLETGSSGYLFSGGVYNAIKIMWYHPIWSLFVLSARFLFIGAVLCPIYILFGLFGMVVSIAMYLRGYSKGGLFSTFTRWEYCYRREFVHEHADRRADSNSLQELKHAPKYREYSLQRRVVSHYHVLNILLQFVARYFSREAESVVISCELLQQITTAKNIDPYLPESEARAAIQRSAAHNSTVNIDRGFVITDHYPIAETVNLAFAIYLQYRQKIAHRDFLLPLPK